MPPVQRAGWKSPEHVLERMSFHNPNRKQTRAAPWVPSQPWPDWGILLGSEVPGWFKGKKLRHLQISYLRLMGNEQGGLRSNGYPISKVSAQGLWEFADWKQSLTMPRSTFPLPGRGSPIFSLYQPPHLAMLSSFPRTGISLQCSPKHSPSLCSIGLLQGYSPKSCTPRTLPWFMLLRLSVIRLIAALLRHWYTTRCIVKSNKYSSHAHTHLLQKQRMIKSRKY